MYASLYPNLYIQFNIAANTQIGKVIIPDQIHPYENRRHYEQWDRAGSFFEDMQTENYIIVGFKWFGLLGIMGMKKYIKQYFNTVLEPSCKYGFEDYVEGRLIQPMVYHDEYGRCPMVFSIPMNQVKIQEWKDYVAINPNQSF